MKSIQRCMAGVSGAVVVWIGLLASPGRAAGSAAQPELLYKTLNVLQRHCLNCHGDAPQAGVRILDYTLLVKERQLIRPRSPETSYLFDLVQGGSMPPGNHAKVPKEECEILREWIRTGAEALPNPNDASYVLWSIVSDLRTLSVEKKRSARYLSLNHLLALKSTSHDLVRRRENLERVLRDLAREGKPPPKLESIEPTKTIFRIDLQVLGWHRNPYTDADRTLNLFDLVLLEYPYGRLPIGSPFYPELREHLFALQQAGQVRPIPYVYADWLTEVIFQPGSPLYSDFLHALKKSSPGKQAQGRSRRSEPDDASDIAPEGTDRGSLIETSFGLPTSSLLLPVRHLQGDEKERRALYEERLAELLGRESKSGTPILPLDALTYQSKSRSDFVFKVIDFQNIGLADPPAKELFAPKEGMALWIKSERSALAEMIRTDKDGGKKIFKFNLLQSGKNEPARNLGLLELKTGEPQRVFGSGNKGIEMTLDPKEEQTFKDFTLYVYPLDHLEKTNAQFPKGTLFHAEGIHDRVVHPLYILLPNGQVKPPDPSMMIKMTLRVTTRRP